jgi:pimeloyl-ACP methyl ester carboxylesterase
VFKNFSDEALWQYVENGTYIQNGRAHLRFSKEWEARCYALVQNVWPLLGELRMPVIGFKGANSNTLPASAWKKWKLKAPAHQFVEIEESGHLLPLEHPDLLAAHVAAFFSHI